MKSIFLFLFIVVVNFSYAQVLQYEINSASATIRKDCFFINWSLGTIDYQSYANDGFALTNAWISKEISNDFQDNMSEELIYVFPNPVSKILNIKVDEQCELPFTVHIYDLRGIHFLHETIANNREIIDLSFLSQGVYIIEFSNDEVQLGKFKIVKY